jgi:hypothetical protein
MSRRKATSTSDILQRPYGVLGHIIKQASKIRTLDAAVKKHLPENIAKHVQVVNLHQGRLTLSATTPAWASKVKFMLPDLLEALRQEPQFCFLTGIDCKKLG